MKNYINDRKQDIMQDKIIYNQGPPPTLPGGHGPTNPAPNLPRHRPDRKGGDEEKEENKDTPRRRP